MNEYYYATPDPTPAIVVLLVVFLFVLLAYIWRPRRSLSYRKTMADMYVVGKIRKLAAEHSIDIPKQIADFRRWRKEQRIDEEELDVSVEKELQEEITNLDKGEDIDGKYLDLPKK